MQPPPFKLRKPKAPTLRDSDWEPLKARIACLLGNGVSLKEVMETMATNYGFHAE
jgi:hypothetical protein